MTPTVQQSAFLTALTSTTSNLALVARAGCGKTSTILLGVDAFLAKFPRSEILVCAYNKAIADEISGKLKKAGHDWKSVQASTLHGLGFGLVRRAFPNIKVDDKKVANLIDTLNDDTAAEYGSQIAKLVGYAKGAGVGFFSDLPIDSVNVWFDLASHYDVNGIDDETQMGDIVRCAQTVYHMSLTTPDVIDFDDMILWPLIKNMTARFGKDLVFLDEAQDLSRARQALARKFLKFRAGRMIVVGDDRQAIYGFSGADAAALENLIKSLSAVVLPLSVTWRCPRAVVAQAKKIVPDIVAAPGAAEGRVSNMAAHQFQDGVKSGAVKLTADDAILCRNTAPLIQIAYHLIRQGTPCKVEGRAIGEGLIQLCKRWKVKSTAALLSRLDVYQDREIQKAQAKGDESKADAAMDKCETLRQIVDAVNVKGLTTVVDVIDFIDGLFSDDVKGVTTLCTYHRAKGREWMNVWLWEHAERCPAKAARQEWQKVQEANLAYVAITRAQMTLTFVG